jgi:uncharacterized protein
MCLPKPLTFFHDKESIMNKPPRHNHIDYIELAVPSTAELVASKTFYHSVFGWTYQDWGEDYADTQSSGIGSGINANPAHKTASSLVVIYVDDLEAARQRVIDSQGVIVKDIFSFPGGRRFHFIDPAGNTLALWSEQ